MNSDTLGRKGEARFTELCADAKLICNPSTFDRTGWDFIVEFPFDNSEHHSLDGRKIPISCHVQVKTILEKNDRVSMRLTAAERLAKELKPAFVYVLKVSEATSEIMHAHLIHVLDQPLANILKRLRIETAAKNKTPNKKTITMSASKSGIVLDPTGAALRDALITQIGSDLDTYVSRKSGQLAKLGFEGKCFETSMTLKANLSDLVDAFLGLKAQLPISNLCTMETRFGIKLPVSDGPPGEGLVSFQPHPADTCDIIVRSSPISPPTTFRGRVYAPAIPSLSRKQMKMLFRTEMFTLIVTPAGCKIETVAVQSQTPSGWLSCWRLLKVLTEGAGTFEIVSHNRPIRSAITISRRVHGLSSEECTFWIRLWERVSEILKFAGVAQEPILTLEAAYQERRRISFFYRLMHPDQGEPRLTFATERPHHTNEYFDTETLCVDYLPLGDLTLAYYGIAPMRGEINLDRIDWRTDKIELKRLVYLSSIEEDYDKFISDAKASTDCRAACIRHFSRDWNAA